jgi:putrescine transport system substrate-binding protein
VSVSIDDPNQVVRGHGLVGDALPPLLQVKPVRLVPDEGSVLFIDSLVVIPSSAKRPDLAHRFINYLMQPEVAALVTAETLYPAAT